MIATKRPVILMADDDRDDRLLAIDAVREAAIAQELRALSSGEELLDYLNSQATAAPPGLVLLDLKMPRKDGHQVLSEIRQSLAWKALPVVMLTTSTAPNDVLRSYELGANSYITKPVTFQGWVDLAKTISAYWFDLALLPFA